MEGWAWPQWTVAILMCIHVSVVASLDGQPKRDKWSFAESLVSQAFTAWLLWAGGFWG